MACFSALNMKLPNFKIRLANQLVDKSKLIIQYCILETASGFNIEIINSVILRDTLLGLNAIHYMFDIRSISATSGFNIQISLRQCNLEGYASLGFTKRRENA